MKAYIFSIGEPTTELCCWQLKRLGFEVVLYKDELSLWHKLKRLYTEADEDFVRVDADIIPNNNIKELISQTNPQYWWYHSMGWDMYANDIRPISVAYIKKQAIPIARKHIDEAKGELRPETYIFRLPQFDNPRRAITANIITGLHGYHQGEPNNKRVRNMKEKRGQNYDWELFDKVDRL